MSAGRTRPAAAPLLDALRDLAAGRGVRRGRHVLDGPGELELFSRALAEEGFAPMRVRDVRLEIGERAPAFLIRGARVDFGWVFYEKFSAARRRKLFGSEVRNAKGDWDVQLGSGSRETVHVALASRMRVDSDRPSSL